MNKKILSIFIIIIAVLGFMIINSFNNFKKEKVDLSKINEVKNTNLNTNIQFNNTNTQNISNNLNNVIETNETEEKISPNAFITYKVMHKKCGHITEKYMEVPKELVNLNKNELNEKYKDWNILNFSTTNIELEKTENDSCDEHFILRNRDGYMTIFKKSDNGNETEYEKTGIATEYLSANDKENLEKGIEVNGLKNLSQLIEDYE